MKFINKAVAAVALAATAALSGGAMAQSDWPTQPIHWIVPFPAGGQAEIASRIIAEAISTDLGQPVLVEAKPGANGNVGAEYVVQSKPDGYTWLGSGVPLSTAPAMYAKTMTFDPLEALKPVTRIGDTTFVMVVPKDVPVSSLDEFIKYAKDQDGQLSYAASGIGSLVHLGSELFKLKAGIKMQAIPYNGQPPAVTDVIANRVQFMIMGLALAKPLIDSGDIKALAVLNSERSPSLPDVPSVVELGYPDLVMSGWAGIQVPAATPDAVVDRISEAVNKALKSPEVQDQMEKAGWTIAKPNTPAEFADFFRKEVETWQQTVKDAGVKTQG